MTENKPKPKVTSSGEKELDAVKQQFDSFEKDVKDMTMDRMNMAPKEEVEPQTKMSQNEIAKSKDIYLKPSRSIASREKFNEKFRPDWEFAKEYVQFIAEHKELIGEKIEMWTKPFPGVPGEFWEIPTNVAVWGPRYLAEQIKRKSYHRLQMKETFEPGNYVGSNGIGGMYGKIVADTTIQRLDAQPVSKRKSIFMGNDKF